VTSKAAKVLKASKPGVEAVDTSATILEALKTRKGQSTILTVAKDMQTYRTLAPLETSSL
jgi:hypothetical protein